MTVKYDFLAFHYGNAFLRQKKLNLKTLSYNFVNIFMTYMDYICLVLSQTIYCVNGCLFVFYFSNECLVLVEKTWGNFVKIHKHIDGHFIIGKIDINVSISQTVKYPFRIICIFPHVYKR